MLPSLFGPSSSIICSSKYVRFMVSMCLIESWSVSKAMVIPSLGWQLHGNLVGELVGESILPTSHPGTKFILLLNSYGPLVVAYPPWIGNWSHGKVIGLDFPGPGCGRHLATTGR